MANASKKTMGQGLQGKRDGSGAMTSESVADGLLGDNQVLSNRDKSQHSGERGLDSKFVQTEQRQDHAGNHEIPKSEMPADLVLGNSSGMSQPMSTTSGQDSSLESQQGPAGGLADPSGTISGVKK
ncbi:hypothetical protein [Salinarimonas soli]|uniref:Uncharacterized protein n=1 Tax=Salinarimonas soli TaxID=1638099 RepID=A0A5B2VFA9_9HYPH|nr:hypothetical protein [Salinarimonas soli]KAA2236877.1 hypothetical protein F0L46_12870 [Salinarimonas soli]